MCCILLELGPKSHSIQEFSHTCGQGLEMMLEELFLGFANGSTVFADQDGIYVAHPGHLGLVATVGTHHLSAPSAVVL